MRLRGPRPTHHRRDFLQCDGCGVPAYLHLSDRECRGFVPPPARPLVRAVERVTESALVLAGRLFYRYPEGK